MISFSTIVFKIAVKATEMNYRRVTPKSDDELIIEQERFELLRRTIAALPEIQKRRFFDMFSNGILQT